MASGALSYGAMRPFLKDGMIDCSTSAAKFFTAPFIGGSAGGAIGDGLGQATAYFTEGKAFDAFQFAQAVLMGGATALAAARAQWAHSRACFAAKTPILWEHGSKAIEEFQVGERVWARDEYDVNSPVELKEIEELFVRTGRILNLHVPGQVIRTTGEHPFYEYTKGWVPANELRPGDRLSSHDGQWAPVEDVLDTGEFETVYNFRVAEFHTYFVGAEDWGFSVWAHNQYSTDPVENAKIQAEVETRLRRQGFSPEEAAALAHAGGVQGTKGQELIAALNSGDVGVWLARSGSRGAMANAMETLGTVKATDLLPIFWSMWYESLTARMGRRTHDATETSFIGTDYSQAA